MATSKAIAQKDRNIRILLCVGDFDCGLNTGKISAIEIGNYLHLADTTSLEGSTVYRYDEEKQRVKIGRRWFHVQDGRKWVGNWCWDAVWVEVPVATAIAEHLRKMGKWSPESGYIDFWDKWENGEPLTFDEVNE